MIILVYIFLYHKYRGHQIFHGQTVLNKCCPNKFSVWLEFFNYSLIAVLLLEVIDNIKLLYKMIIDIKKNEQRLVLDFLFILQFVNS